ncbi:MAG: L,D-transpeptidase [Akkermansia sp.]|nr:L,D-transpeptidase [Akkermansia sp.]
MKKTYTRAITLFLLAGMCATLASCSAFRKGKRLYAEDIPPKAVVRDGVAVTLCDQKLTLFKEGKKVKDYSISSSKFGIGNTNGSCRTPLGIHAISQKNGAGQPTGMVFKGCKPTGEVVDVDAAGRDPVVTRVIQLAGLESNNRSTHHRRIYIHGTPEERYIGQPASYGCIRMKSDDIVDLFGRVHRGMPVAIESCTQATYMAAEKDFSKGSILVPKEAIAKLPVDGLKPTHRYRARKTGNWSRRNMASRFKKRTVRGKNSRRLALRKRTR